MELYVSYYVCVDEEEYVTGDVVGELDVVRCGVLRCGVLSTRRHSIAI